MVESWLLGGYVTPYPMWGSLTITDDGIIYTEEHTTVLIQGGYMYVYINTPINTANIHTYMCAGF